MTNDDAVYQTHGVFVVSATISPNFRDDPSCSSAQFFSRLNEYLHIIIIKNYTIINILVKLLFVTHQSADYDGRPIVAKKQKKM